MAGIRFKKTIYQVGPELHAYLKQTHRQITASITYKDLLHNDSAVGLVDRHGKDTLWETLVYNESDRRYIHESLRSIYAQLKVGGDVSVIDHLAIDRVDYCLYANTHPIRIRIVNQLNDLFDYFYIKQADASRIYGLELEHLLSPNKINYLVKGDTLIEEHITGIPGDTFIKDYIPKQDYNPLRVAKEFIKFNERCLVLLHGDMRNDNFIVEVVPDFDDLYFRMRAIDFDQFANEGDVKVYLPQFFKENNPLVLTGLAKMTAVLELQYQREERQRLLSRVRGSGTHLALLLETMRKDGLSTPANIHALRESLAALYQDDSFLLCSTMGDVLRNSLRMLEVHPTRVRHSPQLLHRRSN